MKWASHLASTSRLEDAVDEIGDSLVEDLGGHNADLVLAFVSPEYADYYSRLADCVGQYFPDALLVGCTAGGVIAGAQEIEQSPALSLTAASLPGVTIKPFHLESMPHRWTEAIGVANADQPSFMVLPDPFTGNAEPLLRWLDNAYPDSVVVGGLASGANHPGGNVLFHNAEQHRSGTLGLAFTGDLRIDTLVAQGCRPIGSPMFITRADGNLLFELDGEPAMIALEALYASLGSRDQKLFETSLFIGMVMNESRQVYSRGDFLIRNLVGIAPERNAVVVGAKLHEQRVVQFHLRDAATSAEDLQELLETSQAREPRGGLMFSCLGRGQHLYGRPNHDSELFAKHHPGVALGGFFCNGEIGQVQGQTHLHGYTSSIALFSPS